MTARTRQPVHQNSIRLIKKFRNLMVDPPPRKHTLIYEGYELKYPHLDFNYLALDHPLRHRFSFSSMREEEFDTLTDSCMAPLLNSVGLLSSIFNYKITDFRKVQSDVTIPEKLADRFPEWVRGCLAEFRYLQGLDPARPVQLETETTNTPPSIDLHRHPERMLVMNGGGKDTVVVAELLKGLGAEFDWFTLGPSPARDRVARVSGHLQSHDVRVSIDRTLDQVGRYRWGTMPFFLRALSVSWIVAAVYGYRTVIAGNEYSANFGNVFHRGFPVNHQYDKSYDLEASIDEVVQDGILSGLRCYSLMRPLHEILIARIFADHPQYFEAFLSCNRLQHRGVWCGTCEKCAFIYISLAPFIDETEIKRIFGANLVDRPKIREHIIDLTNSAMKPWECVGVPDEAKLVLRLFLDRYPDLEFREAPHRSALEKCCKDVAIEDLYRKHIHTLYTPNLLPRDVFLALRSSIENHLGEPVSIAGKAATASRTGG